ncbi:MAG: 3-deoxy-D-manno-octulosonic acid transferase [Bacteroidales bacterium]|nr:3-deoxy-D-manno-octulosonic acid transferase [Bacteroidales bacterium]
MAFIYNIFVHLAYLMALPAALFSTKTRRWISGRFGWRNKIRQWNRSAGPVLWFHAASLGEFEQGLPLMEAFRQNLPDCKLVLTFYSPSGYEIRKHTPHADYIGYLPLDTPYNAARFIRTIRPTAAFFIKYEFWHFFLKELQKNQIPAFLVSGIFRPGQIFYKWYGRWFANNLSRFHTLFVQDDQSAKLAQTVTDRNVMVTGDTRFDRVLTTAGKAKHIPIAEAFAKGSLCIVAGSTWPGDEELLVSYIHQSALTVKFIIAPHEIEADHISRIESALHVTHIRYSMAHTENVALAKVLIIDNIGMLSSLYRYGQLAYIGGGFGKGIHNILEAAVYGMPLVFGPEHGKFREALDLIKAGAAFAINDEPSFLHTMELLVKDLALRNTASETAVAYVQQHAGATGLIISQVLPLFSSKEPSGHKP